MEKEIGILVIVSSLQAHKDAIYSVSQIFDRYLYFKCTLSLSSSSSILTMKKSSL